MIKIIIFIQAILLFLFKCLNLQETKNILIEDAVREVDLTQRYASSQTKLRLTNKGETPITHFYYALPLYQQEQTIIVLLRKLDQSEITGVVVEDINIRHQYNATLIRFELEKALNKNEKVSITIEEKFVNRQEPYPKQITVLENQNILFKDNKYIFSPYYVESQRTIYKAQNIISNTEDEAVTKLRKSGLKYGEYKNISPFSVSDIQIHSENNTPLIYLTKSSKTIEVSHWGNIAVENSYNLVNKGANLKGEFSRVDYNKYSQNSGKNALKSLYAEIPFHATGLWYRDIIGNISTSNAMRDKTDKVVKLNIQPRFPIMGGWKNDFRLGYNLNASRYLYTDNEGNYVLKQLFSIPFHDLLAQEFELRVVLPEGAYNIKPELPFNVDSYHQEITFSYLDSQGRPTLVFRKKNRLILRKNAQNIHQKGEIYMIVILFGKKCLELTNNFRASQNLPHMVWNEQLTFIGMQHSENMGEEKVPFGHQGFEQRVHLISFNKRGVYENVAYCSEGFQDIPSTIVNGWINSPGHRKNLLSNSNVCGISVYKNKKGYWYFTQLLALKC
ncbi:ribophorin i, putative [Ichthyophthirius multifiliis]|uniref:Dolichyl-diphosphooligosaccharide--protein glycosyltransferase subunit 1 n=1 Tax=Ichthyophthirius multifiliis TaxID=5932 RepID=G0QS86_ICHMU|nr:ribophorin i, putative [Ichthyophthirius multifiliis]EGR31951.1 ribophorin i, putative [Ichthyophthirius multifiliis]|eukprot:XP_004035437.1 ribophorin i, putative [Ichthyophthirius multifiliis]